MKHKRRVMIVIAFIQILLMGSAFVGGRMLGEQNLRTNRPAGSLQLPSQLPKDPAAGTGSVQQLQENLITLGGRGFGGPGGGQSANTSTEVAITTETKFYKNVSTGQPGNPGSGQIQVADATMADVKIGNTLMVWGAKNGQRITAEVIYIQTAGR